MAGSYRVAQWGTGNVGLRALAAVIAHPQMELAALRVFSAAKAGRDAGELCGMAPVGIVATLDAEAVVAARPDCIVYMPSHADISELCGLLERGINIATACIGFNDPGSIAPDDRARLEAACATGQASLYSTGSSPGWSTELVPLTLLNMQRRFDRLIITDYADMASRNSPEMLAALGFGADPATQSTDRPLGTGASTPPTFRALAQAVGLPLDEVTTSLEYAVTRTPAEIAIGTIAAGRIGAMRMSVHGWRGGRELLTRHSLWYVTRDTDPAWDYRDSGWRFQVKGDTSLDVSVAFDVEPDDYARFSPGLTAHPVINAVPYVCDAAPGLLTTSDLPMLVPRFVD